jgi:Cof subfamily protein (haloacid dehalogenase superfamily)
VLGPGPQLAPAAGAALRAAAAAGLAVVLASGRMLRSIAAVQDALGLSGPIIAYNGGMVRLPDGRTWEHPIPLATARTIAGVCRDRGYFLQSYYADQLLVPADEPRAREYARIAGVPFRVDPDAVYAPEQPPTKQLVIEPVERQALVRAAVRAAAGDGVELANSYPHYLEVSAAGVDKGSALARVASVLGVPRSAVLAVGDGENDLPMLRYAGLAAAVANAAPAVRQAVTLLAGAPFGDGVAELVTRVLVARG